MMLWCISVRTWVPGKGTRPSWGQTHISSITKTYRSINKLKPDLCCSSRHTNTHTHTLKNNCLWDKTRKNPLCERGCLNIAGFTAPQLIFQDDLTETESKPPGAFLNFALTQRFLCLIGHGETAAQHIRKLRTIHIPYERTILLFLAAKEGKQATILLLGAPWQPKAVI